MLLVSQRFQQPFYEEQLGAHAQVMTDYLYNLMIFKKLKKNFHKIFKITVKKLESSSNLA